MQCTAASVHIENIGWQNGQQDSAPQHGTLAQQRWGQQLDILQIQLESSEAAELETTVPILSSSGW